MRRAAFPSGSRGAHALLAALLLTVLCTRAPARAYHDEQTRSLEETAYILRSGEWQLGLLQLGVGLWRFQLSTRTMPWILGAALKTAMPNLRLDAMVIDKKGVTLSVNAATYYLNSKNISDVDPVLHVFMVPVGGSLSWRINDRHTLSASAQYLRIVTSSEPNEQEDLEFQSGQLADNFQLRASWEWRLSKVSALVSSLRYLPYQGDPVFAATTEVDQRTTLSVEGEVNAEDMQNSVAGNVSGLFSWEHFNLRAGLTYGALFLAGSGLVLPLKYPYPEINFYWRL